MTWDDRRRAALRRIFDAAIASPNPAKIVPRHLPLLLQGRRIVVGAGKDADDIRAILISGGQRP
ncbi:glycerate-2-kinase [Rhizobium mongolense]|uniref:Glycerate-2-kinase n=1 Tax=Rhizobium mongolense TaxID=57676 RepID=A0A7W6WE80_9HYPH|nr:glycerate-2-kinase [Rhizobium mongolense]